jgi:hypothetical protein
VSFGPASDEDGVQLADGEMKEAFSAQLAHAVPPKLYLLVEQAAQLMTALPGSEAQLPSTALLVRAMVGPPKPIAQDDTYKRAPAVRTAGVRTACAAGA